MFDDPKKELQRLQEQLLEEEAWFERELDSAKRMIGQEPEKKPVPRKPEAPKANPQVRNYANGYGQNQPRTREVPVEEEAPMPRKGVKGLLILAGLETLGILGLAAYWVLYLLG